MSEKRRARRRKDEYTGPGELEVEKPSKEEYKVAKWMKSNVKTKKTKFLSHNVEYFSSNKAIDALLKSKFANGSEALFTTREQVVEFLDVMLEHKFYHRAKKVPVSLEEMRGGGGGNGGAGAAGSGAKSTKSKGGEQRDEKRDNEAEAEASGGGGGGDGNLSAGGTASGGEKKEKRKRKIKLDMHPEQIFVDGAEAYVWIYDPIPLHYWIYGLILLLGAIVICLFPLWPPLLRKGVYYLSVAAAGFLVVILVLTIIRLIIFTIVWALSYGKLHFWILPNLTEDVGFFASFWPLYESNYFEDEKSKTSDEKRSKSKKKKESKDSDAEDDAAPDAIPLEPEKIEEIKEHDAEIELRRRHVAQSGSGDEGSKAAAATGDGAGAVTATTAESDAKGSTHTPSESDSEISAKDQFEIISSSEMHNVG